MVTLLLVGVVAGSTVSLAVAGAPFTTPILLVSAQEDESTSLSATAETYDGQVAAEDGDVTVTGSASTDGDVVVVFVGSRGTIVASTLPVTDDRFFTSIDLDEMENGFVDGIVVSPGADETFGTPGDGPDSGSDLAEYVNTLSGRDLTQDQIREVLLEVTVDGDASDDLATDVPFVLAQGNLRLTDVVPNGNRQASGVRPIAAGETMLVRGLTNRQPSGVLVEVTVEGPNETLGPVAAEDWETDGVWTVTLDVPSDATPGTYTVIADDGEQSADVDVEVVAQRAEPTASETTGTAEDGESPTATATATPTPASTQSTTDPTPEPTPEPSLEPTTTETQSPGFGPLVGLAGLFGLLVLARVVRWQ
ncbi:hypothetical protein [Halogranum rubrum]|uniref:Cell surface glycoprotein n=1 Tax=Halogranum salarium B-1 TaxID=1210908 RepID=J3JD45_9EURY|nr:hypothetical protein [Halogranum salarium]EJN57169.1 hypothetical protein HSB1_45550 [Halogranum salarium B-1]